MKNIKKMLTVALIAAVALVLFSGVYSAKAVSPYGVFIGLSPEDSGKLAGYKTVVIDAAEFSDKEVGQLLDNGQEVYSYLNVGSVENFRDYYDRFENITLGIYEDWPDERWVDVSKPVWQDFICAELAKELSEKGINGFFIDNLDVYYQYETEATYQGILTILSRLSEYDLKIMINGGDTFVQEAIERGDLSESGITSINQECVFTAINFDNETFYRQTAEETAYFKEYIALCKEKGLDVFLTEYAATGEKALRDEIAAFCAQKAYAFYISPTLELDGTEPPLRTPAKSQLSYSLSSKTYSGKAQGVKVTPKTGMGKVTATYYAGVSGTSYAKSTRPPVNIGAYGVAVNTAQGTTYKAASNLYLGAFKILPKKTSISKITRGKRVMRVTWKKVSKAQKVTGYQLRYRQKGASKWKTKTYKASTSSVKIKKLKKGKYYRMQVRSYKKIGKVNYYSAWSAVKTSKKIK